MLEKDPFQSIDTTGVGSLVGFGCEMGCEMGIEMALEWGKACKLGVCGEHGGDPALLHISA
jgi:pyruvate,orthophosphate dikinase